MKNLKLILALAGGLIISVGFLGFGLWANHANTDFKIASERSAIASTENNQEITSLPSPKPSQIGINAFEFGNHLAGEIWEHRTSVEPENRYLAEVTGANMYGYHAQKEIDKFASIADRQCILKSDEYLTKFKKIRTNHARIYLQQQGLTDISQGNIYQRSTYAEILNYQPDKLKVATVAALNEAPL